MMATNQLISQYLLGLRGDSIAYKIRCIRFELITTKALTVRSFISLIGEGRIRNNNMLAMILIAYTHFILQHNLVFTQNRSKVRSHYRHLENKFRMPYIPYQQDKQNQTQFGMYVSMEN